MSAGVQFAARTLRSVVTAKTSFIKCQEDQARMDSAPSVIRTHASTRQIKRTRCGASSVLRKSKPSTRYHLCHARVPDARLLGVPVDRDDLEEALGPDFRYGQDTVDCSRCFSNATDLAACPVIQEIRIRPGPWRLLMMRTRLRDGTPPIPCV